MAAILIVSDIQDDFITLCGFCRLCIVEFGNLEVILTKGNGELPRTNITDLLPCAFTLVDLTK
jgi:cytidine deaminase